MDFTYISLLVLLLDDDENQSADTVAKFITSMLVPLPLIPQEVYALFICAHSRGNRQLVLSDCVVYCMCSLALARPSSVYDVSFLFLFHS